MDMVIDISNTVLETDMLILRAWRLTDIDDLYEYAAVEGVGEMAGWRHHDSIEVSKQILDLFIKEKNVFAIQLKENNKVIGSFGLHESWASADEKYKQLNSKEIGYVLSKEYWGRGLIPEAVEAVKSFCFEECQLDVLTVCHFSSNAQSRRVIEKSGFTFVKQSEHYSEQLDTTFTDMKYILLKK